LGSHAVWGFGHVTLALFTLDQQVWLQRHLSHQGHVHILTHFGSTACDWREYLTLALTAWAHESTHVFDDAQNTRFCFLAEVDFFSDIAKRNLLRSGDNDRSMKVGFLQVLND